jgi:hypothetical protein
MKGKELSENMKTTTMMVAAVSGVLSLGSAARAGIFIVNNNNLDSPVANESTTSSQTEGVKNGSGENNGGGTTISSSDSGADAYWQGFQTGPSGAISQLTVDLSVLASSAGVNQNVSGADTATFYLYSFPGANISAGAQIGNAIATVTAAQIESGTPVGYGSGNDIYQYNLINSLSSYVLAANTAYAIVMMTSSGSQDVGWAESNTEATGDMGEFDHVNSGGNNGGAYGQMELVVVPEPTTWAPLAGAMLLLPLGAGSLRNLRKIREV